jgi:hypothetical protein
VFVTFAGQSSSGFVPITCDSTKQIVVIPLDSPLPVGTRVNTTVTVSGDGGEINDFGVFRVQR